MKYNFHRDNMADRYLSPNLQPRVAKLTVYTKPTTVGKKPENKDRLKPERLSEQYPIMGTK